MRYAIVDDEPLAHRVLESHARQVPFLIHVGSCHNALEAMELLRREAVELLFLDIQLPRLSGFDFLRSLTRPPQVIAVTAHREFALEGFELAVADYLLKPVSFERFLKAVNRLHDPIEAPAAAVKLYFKDGKKVHQVELSDLRYVEASANYSLIHLSEGTILSQEKISDLAARLPQHLVRIHKSYLVPIAAIQTIGADKVSLGQLELPIGRTYKANLARLKG